MEMGILGLPQSGKSTLFEIMTGVKSGQSHHETVVRGQASVPDERFDKLVEIYKPDLFCAGIKEKYSIQKLGIPMKQLHSYDSGGPYAGFKGAVNFYREIDRLVNSRVWGLMQAPWQEHPELSATYVWE